MVGILLTVLLLSILVLVHEFGHFIMAKAMGIRVLEFALFMGPKIFSFKKGETTYSIRCIPLGGFCSMEGEETTSDDDRAYSNKPWYKKALVLIAGPAMNIILALVLSVILFFSTGYSSLSVGEVVPGSTAAELGVQAGDKIVALNGSGVTSNMELGTYETMYKSEEDFVYTIKKSDGTKIEVTAPDLTSAGIRTKIYSSDPDIETCVYVASVESDGIAANAGVEQGGRIIGINEYKVESYASFNYYRGKVSGDITYTVLNPDGNIVEVNVPDGQLMGVGLVSMTNDQKDYGGFTVLKDSVDFSFSMIKVTVKSLVWIIDGTASADDVTGPVGMVGIVNDTVSNASSFRSGLIMYVILAILISINLGVFNILPFPALDGGRLVFAIIEGIRGKRIKPEHEGIVSFIGFAILIVLSILIFVKDIIKLFN